MKVTRHTDGREACWSRVQFFFDLLHVRVDEEPREERSKGVSSVSGGNRARGFQEAAAYPSQWNNNGMETAGQETILKRGIR